MEISLVRFPGKFCIADINKPAACFKETRGSSLSLFLLIFNAFERPIRASTSSGLLLKDESNDERAIRYCWMASAQLPIVFHVSLISDDGEYSTALALGINLLDI
ncbi:hypothetical protein WICPIJ_003245 [Wickerhamomyces pijperi]|uniref:Uncharacterized protein n=1 Tax=Wickerhamomyces pijperi TaxID=599730 RepID=A0A9P8QA14_WICPI|nr:hypothetical protein WICPIJ_003245 [Wickerhamomyces pijperi]